MGQLIVFEGTDGSGKATQTRLLGERLAREGVDFRKLDFPRYGQPSCALVELYLGGAFGQRPEDVNAYAASSFYAVDRYASYKQDWGSYYEQGGLLLADRYTTSNAVHQTAKMPEAERSAFLEWLFDFEYTKIGIPVPDRVIYLDVDPAVSQKLMSDRYQGDESKKDIHEKDTEYLMRSQRAARYCADALGWTRVACCQNDTMRSISQIHADVLRAVKEILC